MDVVWNGAGVVIALKHLIGWVSWLIVATIIYGFAWWSVDDDYYFFLPSAVYEWLSEVLVGMSVDAIHTIDVWSTAMVGAIVLHALVLVGHWCLKRTSISYGSRFLAWRRRIFPVVGWTSWLLVLTLAIAIIDDEIHRASDGTLPTYTSVETAAFFAGVFCVVGLIHLAVVRVVRSRS
jgi:hypothetical protein